MNTLIKSAARVLDLLDLFAFAEAPLGASEVARRLAIPKSSAHGLLATLHARGYLTRDGGEFSLPPELRPGKGLVDGPLARLNQIAEPVMASIARQSGESAFLGVITPDGLHVHYIAKAVSTQEVRYDAPLTNLRPAHATSTGLVILAHRPDHDVERFFAQSDLRPITRRTIATEKDFRRALTKARREGLAESSDAHVPGASGISAPVLGRDGYAMGAMALIAPTARYKESRSVMREQVRAAAEHLSRRMRGEASEWPPAP